MLGIHVFMSLNKSRKSNHKKKTFKQMISLCLLSLYTLKPSQLRSLNLVLAVNYFFWNQRNKHNKSKNINNRQCRGRSGGDHIFLNLELRLKPCLVVIIKNLFKNPKKNQWKNTKNPTLSIHVNNFYNQKYANLCSWKGVPKFFLV